MSLLDRFLGGNTVRAELFHLLICEIFVARSVDTVLPRGFRDVLRHPLIIGSWVDCGTAAQCQERRKGPCEKSGPLSHANLTIFNRRHEQSERARLEQTSDAKARPWRDVRCDRWTW